MQLSVLQAHQSQNPNRLKPSLARDSHADLTTNCNRTKKAVTKPFPAWELGPLGMDVGANCSGMWGTLLKMEALSCISRGTYGNCTILSLACHCTAKGIFGPDDFLAYFCMGSRFMQYEFLAFTGKIMHVHIVCTKAFLLLPKGLGTRLMLTECDLVSNSEMCNKLELSGAQNSRGVAWHYASTVLCRKGGS